MPDPDAFLAVCPSRPLMARIGEKWATLIIVALSDGRHRFGELKRRLDGVSQKMLTQTLRNLERDGLVRRTEFGDRVKRVEYELTDIGAELAPYVSALKRWAETHIHAVETAQKRFDQARPRASG